MALGRGGILANKREGDGGTPRGTFHPRHCGGGPTGIRGRARFLAVRAIRPQDAWCEDPADRHYNRPIRLDSEQAATG